MPDNPLTTEQQAADTQRKEATEVILAHPGNKKVIVAGPGTGKTHLFKEIFASKEGGNFLTLTFINALVEDLSLELFGLSEVKTLHGFALSRFNEDDLKLFPKLPNVIREDGNIILSRDIDFEEKIQNIDVSDNSLDFYHQRRKYYQYFSHSDIILGVVRAFEENEEKIPVYSQVVVDEFQDFNKLEVTLIELLATKSPIVIAGDDDQAIYEFKSADPNFIRTIHSSNRPEFSSFVLPFCSRSTSVIVAAINDLVAAAVRNGYLTGRIDKPYKYFPCPTKDEESNEYPKIVHAQLQDGQIAWFISKEIERIAKLKRKKFEVLIISKYSAQSEKIARMLRSKGFTNVTCKEKNKDSDLSYFDGLRLLSTVRIDTAAANLGWRIACKYKLPDDQFAEILHRVHLDPSLKFYKLVPDGLRDEIKKDVEVIKKIKADEDVDTDEIDSLFGRAEFNKEEVMVNFIKSKLKFSEPASSNPAVRKIPITLTTIQSSKGLASDYVFITHFDDRYLAESGITNQGICNVLVALTRARKKVWLLSTTSQGSEFLGWIERERIQEE